VDSRDSVQMSLLVVLVQYVSKPTTNRKGLIDTIREKPRCCTSNHRAMLIRKACVTVVDALSIQCFMWSCLLMKLASRSSTHSGTTMAEKEEYCLTVSIPTTTSLGALCIRTTTQEPVSTSSSMRNHQESTMMRSV
jgi:hypothetical protein